MFIVESTVFIFYNFFHLHFNHGLFITSMIFAILYLVINFVFVLYVLLTPLSFDEFSEEDLIEGFYESRRTA